MAPNTSCPGFALSIKLRTVKPSTLLGLFCLAAAAAAQVPISSQEAAGAPAYGPRLVQASSHSLQGKLIKLQFVCRSSITDKTADGGLTGEVLDSPTTRITVDVQVPPQAVAWYMSVPTTGAAKVFTVYARLSTGKFGQPVAVLLGREVHTDTAGSSIVW